MWRRIICIFLFACVGESISSSTPQYIFPARLPVWLEFVNLPDSLQDFSKVYLQTKGVEIISMKEAIETMMANSNNEVMNKITNGDAYSQQEIEEIVRKSFSKPVCLKLSLKAFTNSSPGGIHIDSVWWTVASLPLHDTSFHPALHRYYGNRSKKTNDILLVKDLIDTIAMSRELK